MLKPLKTFFLIPLYQSIILIYNLIYIFHVLHYTSLLVVNKLRQYLQTTKNFKITNINNWLNERLVLCKSEQVLMDVGLKHHFFQGAGVKLCHKHRLCIWSFIQFSSAGKNFASQVLWATPTLPDTTRHKGLEHPPCLVISLFHGTAWAHAWHTARQIPSRHPGCALPGFGSGRAAGVASERSS